MRHIGVALLNDGKPAGPMKALCGAITTAVIPKGTRAGDLCPACKRLNEKGA